MNAAAKLYITTIVLLGLAALVLGIYPWQSSGTMRFLVFLFFAVLSSTFKIRLPRMQGTMSLSFLFILVGILDFSFCETLLVACATSLVQTLWKPKSRPKFERIAFNIAAMVLSAGFARAITQLTSRLLHIHSLIVLLGLATFVFLLSNTALIAAVISLAEDKRFPKQWSHCFYWSFPFFLIGATGAGLISATVRAETWFTSLLLLPLLYLSQLWYRAHMMNAAQEKIPVAGFQPQSGQDRDPATPSVVLRVHPN